MPIRRPVKMDKAMPIFEPMSMKTSESGTDMSVKMFRNRTWLRDEAGVSEGISAIIVLPLIAFMLFALVESGIYLISRAQFDNIVQSVTRNVMLEGGYFNERGTALPDGKDWNTLGTAALQQACDSGQLRCIGAPTFSCNTQVAPTLLTKIECTATMKYKPVSSLSKSKYTSLGFSGLYYDTSGNPKTLTVVVYGLPATSLEG